MSLLLTILAWIFAFIACTIVSLILYTTWNYGKLNGLGFPVIPPYLIFGSNYMEPYRVQSELSMERHAKYGMVYGAYDGRTPVVYIADPKISRQIRTVDSECFRNHGFNFGNDPIISQMLDLLDDDKWKFVRSALTPIFTSGKIKQMSKIVKKFGESYAQDLCNTTSKNGKVEKFCMREYAPPLIIESIAKAFCGIEISNARDPNNEFIKSAKAALGDTIRTEDWLNNLFKMFPFLLNIFGLFDLHGMDFFVSVLKSSLEAKLKSVQNLEKSNDAAGILAEMLHKLRQNDPKYKSLGIDENTILAQGWEAFAASYISILDVLIALSYELAIHPEIQEKMYEELKGCSSEDLADETNIPYTTGVVMEALRLYTQFDKPERLCNKTWTYEGITIPKGTQVMFPISAIHYNPKYYPEPMTFQPERFLDKSKIDPNLFLTFGQGPRACIGSRFGIEVIRILLISLVLKFQIVKRHDTEYVKKPGSLVTIAMKPVLVDLVVR